MSSSFADLGVTAEAVRALRARSLTSAFPVQAAAIPPGLEGRDVCGRAPTGSGKTIAFGIPVAARVGRGRPGRPQGLILAPTRELARQIETEMAELMGPARRARLAAFYGGVGFGPQLAALRRGIDLAVACPGRLDDLIARGAVSLDDVSVVVLDEADRMADLGFLPVVRRLLDQVRPDRQTLLFSATLDGDVDVLIRRYQREPVHVSVDADEQTVPTTHHWVDCRREDRISRSAHLIASHGSTVVFCRTKHGTDRVTRQLKTAGVRAVALHGGRSQSQRDRALQAFSSGEVHALVATDVAARGIHVDGVGCVIHFDLPTTAKDYLHRSGRTGRAGADGVVFAFVTPEDPEAARALRRAVGPAAAPADRSGPIRPAPAGGPEATAATRTTPPSGGRPDRDRPGPGNDAAPGRPAVTGRRRGPHRAPSATSSATSSGPPGAGRSTGTAADVRGRPPTRRRRGRA